MTNHSAVYFIAAESYDNLGELIKAGIVDQHILVHGGGATPPAQFPRDCLAVGGSPILNNGNDGVPGWNGADSYNANVAALGYHAVGGESEGAAEIDSIMSHLIFLDYGGEGTAGGTMDDVWEFDHPGAVSGHGAASYLETYDSNSNLWGWNVMGRGMLNAKSHGVKEIGLLVGNWMINHSTAQDYVNIASQMEANGVTFAGIGVWAGYGSNMNSLYEEFAPWYALWQSIWPPNMTPMAQRYAGVTPVPPAPPVTKITAVTAPAVVGSNMFVKGSDNALWWNSGTGAWKSLGGTLTSAPCAFARSDLTGIDVFVRGADGSPYHISVSLTGAATSWVRWPGRILAGTNPQVSASGDLYVIGEDHAIWKLTTGKWTSLGNVLKN